MGQLRPVSLHGNKIVPKNEAKGANQELVDQINYVTSLLQEHNRQVSKIVESYHRRVDGEKKA